MQQLLGSMPVDIGNVGLQKGASADVVADRHAVNPRAKQFACYGRGGEGEGPYHRARRRLPRLAIDRLAVGLTTTSSSPKTKVR